jgi:hypothetical protein
MVAALPFVALASTVIGTGVSIMGSMQQASAAESSAKYQAQVARNNQIIAEQNASYARQVGQAETETSGMKTAAMVGSAVAAQGASGLDAASGSPVDVVRGTREIGRFDTLNLVRNAELRARGFDIEASNQGATAKLSDATAKQAGVAGLYSAGSSILGGASNFSDKWIKFQNEGVFGGSSLGDWSPRGG